MPAYRAVLFDFFGTLTHAVHRGATHAYIARWLGCEPTDFTRALDGSFMQRARGAYGSPMRALRRVAATAGARPSHDRLLAALSARKAALRADTRLREDAVPVLRALREKGLRTALISDCTHELPLILPSLPIADLLDTVVFSIDVGTCKPDPAMYLRACERLRVQPHECLYIGDGGSHELSGAQALGISAIRLTAPDLCSHLRFEGETDWTGPTADSLTQAISYLDAAVYRASEADEHAGLSAGARAPR